MKKRICNEFSRSLESLSDENALLESEPASLGLGPVFDVKFVQNQNKARMVALDDTNSLQVHKYFIHNVIYRRCLKFGRPKSKLVQNQEARE